MRSRNESIKINCTHRQAGKWSHDNMKQTLTNVNVVVVLVVEDVVVVAVVEVVGVEDVVSVVVVVGEVDVVAVVLVVGVVVVCVVVWVLVSVDVRVVSAPHSSKRPSFSLSIAKFKFAVTLSQSALA